MARYIDADTLIAFEEKAWDWNTVNFIDTKTAIKQIISDIKHEPTADVRENVKGVWLYKGLDFEIDSLYQCSACKHYHWSKSNYCPNCGADMRGGDAE